VLLAASCLTGMPSVETGLGNRSCWNVVMYCSAECRTCLTGRLCAIPVLYWRHCTCCYVLQCWVPYMSNWQAGCHTGTEPSLHVLCVYLEPYSYFYIFHVYIVCRVFNNSKNNTDCNICVFCPCTSLGLQLVFLDLNHQVPQVYSCACPELVIHCVAFDTLGDGNSSYTE
jgi:hypothetical protein